MSPLRISPSALPRTLLCPGSVTMQHRYPEEDGEEARDGTAAHFALAEQLQGRMIAEGQIAPNGVILTLEMLEAVDVATDYLARRVYGAYGLPMIERAVKVKRIHEQCEGTLDYACWLKNGHLFVADFKYGHKYVPVEGNAQLIAYAIGLLGETPLPDTIKITLAIIQPRCFMGGETIREWTGLGTDLRGMVNRLVTAAEQALGPDPHCHVNEHCGTCSARHACPTLQRTGYDVVSVSERAIPFDLPPAAAALEWRMLKRAEEVLKARRSGLEEQLFSQVAKGAKGTGLRIAQEPGREEWTLDSATVITVGESLGVALGKPPAAMTPNQARAAGVPADVVAGMSARKQSTAKLVPDTGETALARVFATPAPAIDTNVNNA